MQESSKRFYVSKPKSVKSKKKNSNGTNSNVTMFMEDNDEMADMESSSSCQQSATPNYLPPAYQQSTFQSYQPSQNVINQQQPPPYPGDFQPSVMQNQQPTFQQQNCPVQSTTDAVSIESNAPQLNTSFLPMFTPVSIPTPVSPSQLPTEIPLNFNTDPDSDSNNKLTMIKSFSTESGMNDEWAKK